ncbi:hypothetical protein JIX56_43200 [Streptomyces sp. CA-210063]|nr:hypothetical protein [Streptomyces sp. CA-210063]UUU36098.1 hypothetical protein JIX56_43200 [Streptomyces sp. CA-210063]
MTDLLIVVVIGGRWSLLSKSALMPIRRVGFAVPVRHADAGSGERASR